MFSSKQSLAVCLTRLDDLEIQIWLNELEI